MVNLSDCKDKVVKGKVVFISGDLMFASRVRAAAESAGFDFALSGNLPPQSPENTESIRYVVLDLATMSKHTQAVASGCAETYPNASLIAYGPHVQVQHLDAAREAGIANVLTRGQFNNQLPTIFQPTD